MAQANGTMSPTSLYSPLALRKASGDFRLNEPGGGGDGSGGAAAAVQEVRADVKRLEKQMEALTAQVALVLKAVQPSSGADAGGGDE